MSMNQARTATAVAIMLSSGVTLADGFQKGFYIGANTGASFVTGQTNSELTRGSDFLGFLENSIGNGLPEGFANPIVYRDEASARGYNGGLLVGWNFYCDREYIYGVELSGNLYSNRGYQTWWTYGVASILNFQESWDLSYSAELTFKPGWLISNTTELYAIIGVSVAQVNTELKNLNSDTVNESDPVTVENEKTIYGFVLGAGIQKQLCNRLSVFTSYQYTYYSKASLSDGVEGSFSTARNDENTFDPATHITDRKLRIDSNVFKVGLIYTF
jgi:opacity protein-like surface antigen